MREMKDSGVAWIGKIPIDWEIIRFKYLHNGLNTGEAIGKEYWTSEDNDTIFYTAGLIPITTNYMDFPLWKFTEENDLLLARNGTPYVYYPVTGACYTDHIIRAKMKENTNRKFIQYSLSQSISYVVVNSVSIATWSASIWNEQFITFPPLEDQQKIAAHLDRKCTQIDALISNAQQQIEKLKAYKQSVITETVTKGLDPDVAMKDSGVEWIGEIPEHWREIKMKYVMYIRARLGWKGLKADEYVDNGYTFIGTPNIDENGNIDWDNVYYITKERYEESPEIMLSQGDVLLTKDGAGIGKCAYIDRLPTEATTNGSLAVITCNNRLEGKYLFYYLKSIYFQKYIDRLKAGMGVPHLFQGDLKEIVIPLPSIEDQNSIIEILDRKCSQIDKLIALKQQKIEKLQQYKKSLIYEYVTGKKEVI